MSLELPPLVRSIVTFFFFFLCLSWGWVPTFSDEQGSRTSNFCNPNLDGLLFSPSNTPMFVPRCNQRFHIHCAPYQTFLPFCCSIRIILDPPSRHTAGLILAINADPTHSVFLWRSVLRAVEIQV